MKFCSYPKVINCKKFIISAEIKLFQHVLFNVSKDGMSLIRRKIQIQQNRYQQENKMNKILLFSHNFFWYFALQSFVFKKVGNFSCLLLPIYKECSYLAGLFDSRFLNNCVKNWSGELSI